MHSPGIVNENFCDNQPINSVDYIQPHGVLFVIDDNTFTV
jgi:light-regulated signal transduction histidine kinase (bacteriophytochrome)